MSKTSNTREHERFCKKDGWQLTPGKHKKYRKKLSNGEVLSTSISHANKEYSKALFNKILTLQLKITEEEYFEILK